MNTPLTHELEAAPLGRNDICITSKAGSGGTLSVTATIAFAATVDIPSWSRQNGEVKDAEKDHLRQVVRDRFYGDVRRAAAKAAVAVDKLQSMRSPNAPEWGAQWEAVQAAFMPLLNAGDSLVLPP